MSSTDDALSLLQNLSQVDWEVRAPRQKELLQALRVVSENHGPDEARTWARRAVSPLLDYSALNALHRFLPLRSKSDTQPPVRIALLAGPTTMQLCRLLEVFLAAEGIAAEVYESDYGLFRQEILTDGSGLDLFQPHIVILATGARDVSRWPMIDMSVSEVGQLAQEELAGWTQLWDIARRKWNATLIQNNFEIAPGAAFGHFSLRQPGAPENYLDRLNRLLADRAPPFVVLHDLRGLAAEAGARAWFDATFYFEFKFPCGAEPLVTYAHSLMSLIRSVQGKSRKVLVLDLDNTLWGGVVGDAGAGGIKLGDGSGEGEAFLAFQRYARSLKERGVLLAVCSKNDDDKAREPFEQRPDMVLKLTDFVAFTANWQNKADNLREIARQLELGLDSFVFVDDNPAERALVRRLAPEVSVPDMPTDPAGYIPALTAHRYFEVIAFTREDSTRTRYYADNARRRDLAAKASDLHSFLGSLDMKMAVSPVNDLNVERVTQLINKSNQFNLTTRRVTLAQVVEISKDPQWRTLTFSLRDTLGDNGLISVLLLKKSGDALVIDTWLMSCRVLQRGVEQFVRNEIVEVCLREGLSRIEGTYIRSPKNSMVEQHYSGLGFAPAGAEEGRTFWTFPVQPAPAPLPHFIERDAANV